MGAHLDTNCPVHVHELSIDKLLLILLNLGVLQCPPNQSLQRPDGVFEVGGFGGLGGFTNESLARGEGYERAEISYEAE